MGESVARRVFSFRFTVVFFLVTANLGYGGGYSIKGCSAPNDGYIDIREDTGTTVTCDGIGGGQWMYWALDDSRIGTCKSNLNCLLTDPDSSDYILTRPSGTRSNLTIRGNFRQKADKTLLCSRNDNSTNDRSSCKLNIVYPGSPSDPFLTTDPVSWTVNMAFQVDKVYSSRGLYECRWTQKNVEQNTVEDNSSVPVLSRFQESEKEYFMGGCSLSWPLPTEYGNYTFFGTLIPAAQSIEIGTVVVPYRIKECSEDGYIDIREDKGTTVTCEGPGMNHNLYWALAGNRIGDCNYAWNCQLTDTDKSDYILTRPSHFISDLTIKGHYREKAEETLVCSKLNNDTRGICRISIIYPGHPRDPSFTTDPVNWTVNMSFGIEKVYSSTSPYGCKWTRINDDQNTVEYNFTVPDLTSFQDDGKQYFRGLCSLSWPLPAEDAEYLFEGTIIPGAENSTIQTGTVVIKHPGDPSVNCSKQSVVEHGDLTCHCNPSTTSPGQPAPILSWQDHSNTDELKLVNVSRQDNGTEFTCQLSWGPSVVKTANFTLQVIYGPSTVSILNTTGHIVNTSATLVCQAGEANPDVSYRWQGVACENASRGNTCVFLASLEKKGKNITCTATNRWIETLSVSVTRRIEVLYPPSSDPVIHGYEGQNITEGSSLTLNCTVSGGNPRVQFVRFSCGQHTDKEDTAVELDSTSDSYVSSEITIDRLSVEDNGTVCTCSAVWQIDPRMYTETSTVVLRVIEGDSEAQTATGVSTAAIAGGVGAVFAVAVIAIVVIAVVIVSRKRRSADDKKKGDNHGNAPDDEFEEHINPVYGIYEDREDTSPLTNHSSSLTTPAFSTTSPNVVPSPTSETVYQNRALAGAVPNNISEATYQNLNGSLNVSPAVNGKEEGGDHTDIYAVVDKSKKTANVLSTSDLNNVSQTTTPLPGDEEAKIGNPEVQTDVHESADELDGKLSKNTSSPDSADDIHSHVESGPDVYSLARVVSGLAKDDTPDKAPHEADEETGSAVYYNTVEKPAVKPKTVAKPEPVQRQTTAGSLAEDKVASNGEGIRTPETKPGHQHYENIKPPSSQALTQDDPHTKSAGDEYNTLNLKDPHAAERDIAASDYSHLGHF